LRSHCYQSKICSGPPELILLTLMTSLFAKKLFLTLCLVKFTNSLQWWAWVIETGATDGTCADWAALLCTADCRSFMKSCQWRTKRWSICLLGEVNTWQLLTWTMLEHELSSSTTNGAQCGGCQWSARSCYKTRSTICWRWKHNLWLHVASYDHWHHWWFNSVLDELYACANVKTFHTFDGFVLKK